MTDALSASDVALLSGNRDDVCHAYDEIIYCN